MSADQLHEPNSAFDHVRYGGQIAIHGFAVVPEVIDLAGVEDLRLALDRLDEGDAVRRKGGVYGVRNLLEAAPAVRELARSMALRRLVEPVLGSGAFAVRGILFDKIPTANWKIFWHQDSVIAVKERKEAPGYRGWSQKAGVWQVEPPAAVMAGMLALRVHLDDCGADNGPLRVLLGSHRYGWIDDDLDRWKSGTPEVTCEVPLGGVLAMRPLLLHASAPAVSPAHRRVIHLEYAAGDLPGGLEWYERVGFDAPVS
jgi:hypothetical protein